MSLRRSRLARSLALAVIGLNIFNFSVAAFTTPADPIGLNIGVITATGATNAYALRLAPPTGAGTNYLIAHTTPATFNVTAAGAMTLAGAITTGAPAGGTAAAWKHGILVTTASVVDTTKYIQLDVGGVLYKVATMS